MAKSGLGFPILPTEIVTRMTTAMGPAAKSSRQGLRAGGFGFMILALSLNQLCDLGLLHFSVPQIPHGTTDNKGY